MKRAAKIVLTGMFLSMIACASDSPADEQTEYAETCRDEATNARVPDEECERGSSGRSWAFVKGSSPAVGRPYPHGSYTTVRPSGTIGRVPATGGFGTFGGGTGS